MKNHIEKRGIKEESIKYPTKFGVAKIEDIYPYKYNDDTGEVVTGILVEGDKIGQKVRIKISDKPDLVQVLEIKEKELDNVVLHSD